MCICQKSQNDIPGFLGMYNFMAVTVVDQDECGHPPVRYTVRVLKGSPILIARHMKDVFLRGMLIVMRRHLPATGKCPLRCMIYEVFRRFYSHGQVYLTPLGLHYSPMH